MSMTTVRIVEQWSDEWGESSTFSLARNGETPPDSVTVDVPAMQLAKWEAAERAYWEALRAYNAAHAEMRELYEAEEQARFEALPPPDPDAPPPGPIRDLFPKIVTLADRITFTKADVEG